mgnify:CR=1 FL=1
MKSIDLNADLGEGEATDIALLDIVSSCNIACGGHTGDADSMQTTIAAANARHVAVGAHPSYPDREGFGRRSGYLDGDALRDSLLEQIGSLLAIASANDVTVRHVKPHGALYNDAAADRDLAAIVVAAIAKAVPGAAIVSLPDSEMQAAAERAGMEFLAEGFIDRAYQDNGQLVPRTEPGAVHESLDRITAQAIALAGAVDTLCIHGDTPGAVQAASATRAALEAAGVEIRAIGR